MRKTMLDDWLATPLGQRCLAHEQQLVGHALDRVFGEHLVQIGRWGAADAFLSAGRTQRCGLVDWQPDPGVDAVCDPEEIGLASDSVDAVILPHTLERIAAPHALLREVDRILRPDGQVVVLSFTPTGPWGVRHMFSVGGYPVGQKRMIRERRLRDWLDLLSYEVAGTRHYCHTLPLERLQGMKSFPDERWASRWLPILAGGYLLHAQKSVRTITAIRPMWRKPRLRAVGGLKPTTRTVAAARVAEPRVRRRRDA